MAEDFMEISKEDIENVENALKINSDYKLKNSKFDVKSFEKAKDIVLIQLQTSRTSLFSIHMRKTAGIIFPALSNCS